MRGVRALARPPMTLARLFRVQSPLGVAAGGALVFVRGVLDAAQASVVTAVVNLLNTTAVNLYPLRRLAAAEANRWS